MLVVLVAAVALAASCGGGAAPPPAEAPEPTLEEQSPPDGSTPREGRNQGEAPDSTDDSTKESTPQDRPRRDDPNISKAVVERIVDGDTLEVRGQGSPLPQGRTVRVRLLEIDAPEKGTCFSAAATDRLAALLPLGSSVRVERDSDLKDRYGRYLLYVWNDQGRFVNRSLVSTGHAKAVLYEPNDKHWPSMVRAGDSARRGGTGLWSACDRRPSPPDVPAPPPDVPAPDVPEPDVPEPDVPEPDVPEPDVPEPDVPDVPEPDTPEPPDVPESPADEEPPEEQDDSYPPGPPPGPDVDCSDLPGPVRVGPDDPHDLDADGDGIGCE